MLRDFRAGVCTRMYIRLWNDLSSARRQQSPGFHCAFSFRGSLIDREASEYFRNRGEIAAPVSRRFHEKISPCYALLQAASTASFATSSMTPSTNYSWTWTTGSSSPWLTEASTAGYTITRTEASIYIYNIQRTPIFRYASSATSNLLLLSLFVSVSLRHLCRIPSHADIYVCYPLTRFAFSYAAICYRWTADFYAFMRNWKLHTTYGIRESV